MGVSFKSREIWCFSGTVTPNPMNRRLLSFTMTFNRASLRDNYILECGKLRGNTFVFVAPKYLGCSSVAEWVTLQDD